MSGYGQFCPVAKAAEVVGERWTLLVIRELGAGSQAFNDLRKGLPLMSPSLLSTRLKSLEAAGIVVRTESEMGIRYTLTKAGQELKPIVLAIGTWGHRWVRSKLEDSDLNPSLLMWDIHRTINTKYFGDQRTVLMFEFEEYRTTFRRWWLVVENDDVDVCMKDPGHEVDFQIITNLKTLTGIWMGDITLNKAVYDKLLKMTGSTKLKRDISKWFGANYFASVKPAPTNQS